MQKSQPSPGFYDQTARAITLSVQRIPWSQHEWEIGVVFVALYLLLERLSFIHPWGSTGITPWNPQTALALGFVLVRGLRCVPALFLAMVFAEVLVRVTPAPLGLAVLGAAVMTLGYCVAGHALSAHLQSNGRIRSLRDFAWMLGITALAPVLIGAAYIGINAAFGLVEWRAFPQVLLRYWIGDVVGVLAILPFLLALADRTGRRTLAQLLPRWETWLQSGCVIAIICAVFFSLPGGHVKYFFVLFLPLIWIAARHGLIGAAAALAFIQAGLILVVQLSDSGIGTVFEIQARMLALSLTGLLLGVVVDERERAQERLRQSLRLAAAGEMAAALAHEVNQPLTALVTYGKACQHMLAQTPTDMAQVTQTVGKVSEQAQRVGAIVKRLRDFLRSGTMNLEWVSAGDFLETVRGVQSIKLFGRQEERRSRWLNLVVDAVNQDLVTQRLGLVFRSANGLVFGVERVVIIWLGALLVLDSAFSVGMLFAFLAYKEQFSARVAGLIDKMIELRMLNLQGERLADIVLTAPEEESQSAPVDAIDASLEVRALSFRYSDTEPFVLLNCSFTVAPGESLAIVGASGGGKTTLLKIMLGLLSPTDGKILAGGIDIQKLGIERYRKLVGTVMQDDQLFAGSIADNISFFDASPDHSAIENFARLASVHDDISAMPMGYNTLIGDMGAALSGGQRQRILLARALYKRPRILFLDEATSALDVQKERAVNEAIRALNLTRILIAHRPETIASAERVIVLQGGKVAQDLRRVPVVGEKTG